MPKSLLDLANDLDQKNKNVKQAASEAAKKLALIALERLVNETPVDTSTALSNWQISVGIPATSFIDAYVPGYLGYTASASIRQAIAVGKANLETKKPGQTIYLTNNTPYIRDLNSGSSKQAPAGFVEATMLVVRTTKLDFKV